MHVKQNALPRVVNVFFRGIFRTPTIAHLYLTCLLPRRHEDVAAAPPAIAEGGSVPGRRRRELFHGLVEATGGNSTPRTPGLRGAEAASGHPVGHVRADRARHGRGVRVAGGAGGEAQGLAGEVAGGGAAPRPRQVRHGRRCRLLPRQVRVRARDRRRCRVRAVVSGRSRIARFHGCVPDCVFHGAGCSMCGVPCELTAGFTTGPAKPPGPVPVYRSDLVGNRSVPVEFKFEFKKLSSTGSYRYTGRFDRFTGRFDRFEFKSKFKIACVTGLERYTGRFDRFTKWALMDRLIFFLFFFGLTLNARKVC